MPSGLRVSSPAALPSWEGGCATFGTKSARAVTIPPQTVALLTRPVSLKQRWYAGNQNSL